MNKSYHCEHNYTFKYIHDSVLSWRILLFCGLPQGFIQKSLLCTNVCGTYIFQILIKIIPEFLMSEIVWCYATQRT